MASSKLISSSSSSRSRNSDLSRRPKPKPFHPSSSSSAANQSLNDTCTGYINTASPAPMTVDGLFRDVYNSTLPPADAQMDTAGMQIQSSSAPRPKTVDEVWEEIVSGGSRRECKEEVADEMMTLEDFLARAGAVEEDDVNDFPPEAQGLSGGMFGFDQMGLSPYPSIDKVEGSMAGFGNAAADVEVAASGGGGGGRVRGKRCRAVLEPLDKAAQQRQRRMIKNRESAARSRERKQAYQVELELLVVRLEEENEQLLKEEAERTEERLKQLMENVIPVVEKRRPSRVLRRVRSLQW
ncbi:G-box-binding factor 4-like isoform X2 [Argentina anserina]|uniref:G-box-binding factor 4-like isoform X2 n=1 Tax=Argentina anserina TaxID=57926 RepID=UPI0021768647|nr:G-box-binding factor 4-like isoform X2 [Potentilla anserina]